MEKAYLPKNVEDRLYERWLSDESFKGKVSSQQEAFSIVIPPPNVTGVLTMGHVLNNTVQDILARRARQQGKSVLWLPGTDHAGIATQTKVENALKEDGRSKDSLGREEFVLQACLWRDKHGGIILNQLKKLGCSCDWERNVHTLDEDYSKSVLTAFVKLFEKGYVYRGQRMVNWCPASLTALSDEEVIMKPQSSILYKVRYEVIENPGTFLEVCTTRPETIVGDVALAMHPEDERWKALEGKHVRRPINPIAIPIIADQAVDRDFGTGVLKITPAHDKLDFEIAQRHDLPMVEILNKDGTLNEVAGVDLAGIDRFSARKLISEKLKDEGSLIGEEPYQNNVGFSERANVPIEPRLSEQWFLKYPRVEEAKKVVREGIIKFYPERWEKNYLHWLDNIQDWCISRQLWWGHRIPVWYRKGKVKSDPSNWHVSVSGPPDPENWEQDEDVLDTWASSWLWPLATLGWPDDSEMERRGLNHFYPTSVLVTGPDIIFFWVARMIMAGLEFNGRSFKPEDLLPMDQLAERIPFKQVYFTGIIRDSEGRKMSKSLGNSPDPLDLIEKYGADGLRHGIMSIAPKGQDIRFSEERIEQGRNFCNKLWNVSRFRTINGPTQGNLSVPEILAKVDADQINDEDHAILLRLLKTIEGIENSYDQFEFNAVLQSIYKFFWNDFCDWYVESSKNRMKNEEAKVTCLAIQDFCLREILLLLHPFTPFITEELWNLLGFGKEDSIQFQAPTQSAEFENILRKANIILNQQALEEIDAVRELITQLRALKAERKLSNNRQVEFFYFEEENNRSILANSLTTILEAVGAARIKPVETHPSGLPAVVSSLGTFYLDLTSGVAVEEELSRVRSEIEKLEKVIVGIQSKLQNEKFVSNAPPQVVEGAKAQLLENQTKLSKSKDILRALTESS